MVVQSVVRGGLQVKFTVITCLREDLVFTLIKIVRYMKIDQNTHVSLSSVPGYQKKKFFPYG